MFRRIPVVVAVMAVIACGIVHGFWTDRWVKGAEPTAAAELVMPTFRLRSATGKANRLSRNHPKATRSPVGSSAATCIARRARSS